MGEAAAKIYTFRRHRPEETILYKALAAHVETFLADREAERRTVPQRVVKELRGYLKCGILQYGFIRMVCPGCQFERAVAYSCKGRGFCPSCFGKRMAETVRHLIDNVLPVAPFRQWVLTFPFALRYWLATSRELVTKINRITTKEISKFYLNRARDCNLAKPLTGMVTFIQRAGSMINLNVHLHIIALDGVFLAPDGSTQAPRLQALAGPSDADVAACVARIAKRTIRLLRRRGYLDEEGELVAPPDADEMFRDNEAMTEAMAASVQSRIAFGPRAGQYVRKIGKSFGFEEETPVIKGRQCASINGFNLHAATYIAASERDRLENLVSYVARPPVATERLKLRTGGELEYKMKRIFADGTSAIVLSAHELIEKLCALVPPARSHQTLYTGIFSSHSKWRNLITPNAKARKGFNPETVDREKVKNHPWAKLLMRIFKIDVGTCERCGTDMEIRAAVQDPDGIARYLRHISLDAHPPPIAPARSAVAFVAEVSAGPALAAGSAAWEYELEGHDKFDTH